MTQQIVAPFFVVNQFGLCVKPPIESLSQAEKLAEELARKNQGTIFYVTQAINGLLVPKPDVVVINYD